uniref:Uncharacterized protein n=1 Tax=Sphaerodactylus townsendi TaxID=933632 RepID=A0ACB8EQM1_9SAUR
MGEPTPLERAQESNQSILDYDNEPDHRIFRSVVPVSYNLPDPGGGVGAYQLERGAAAPQLVMEYKPTSVHFSSEWPVPPCPPVFKDPGLVHGEIGSVPQECSHLAKEWQLGARSKELAGLQVQRESTLSDL